MDTLVLQGSATGYSGKSPWFLSLGWVYFQSVNKTEVEIVQLGKALSLKWTNVARASVAWIKVELKSVLEAPRNLRLKFGQGQVGNS